MPFGSEALRPPISARITRYIAHKSPMPFGSEALRPSETKKELSMYLTLVTNAFRQRGPSALLYNIHEVTQACL